MLIRIEPKVYFANERTFLKWLEFSVMLSAIALGMLNFQHHTDKVGVVTSTIFTFASLFAIAYSGALYIWRALKLRERSSSNVYFDSFGPSFLCFAILAATVINFAMRLVETQVSRTARGVLN